MSNGRPLLPIFFSSILFIMTLTAHAGGNHDGHGHHGHHEHHGHHGHHGHDGHEEEHEEKGPNGGRLLSDDDGFALEMTIYEPGIPPQSRVYAYFNDKPLSPQEVTLAVALHRFEGVDNIAYKPQDTYLLGQQFITEPHSFAVKVRATYKDKEYQWEYESFEGRVVISAKSAALSGIQVQKAKPRLMTERLPVLGQVNFNQDKVRYAAARYTGVVRTLNKSIGDPVRKGETLGIVMGTDSLSEFSIKASGSGVIISKDVSVGEVVSAGDILFALADLSTVWLDFAVYPQDVPRISAKQKIKILSDGSSQAFETSIAYVAPFSDPLSQSLTVRAIVANPKGELRPGLFLKGEIEITKKNAAVTVKREAIQTFRDWQVVYRNRGTLYEIVPIELGLIDGDFVEVLSGLSAGDAYVSKNSFVIKADIGKADASHEH